MQALGVLERSTVPLLQAEITKADPGVLGGLAPLPPRIFQNHAVFKEKPPILSTFGAQGPPKVTKILLGPLDQNPG